MIITSRTQFKEFLQNYENINALNKVSQFKDKQILFFTKNTYIVEFEIKKDHIEFKGTGFLDGLSSFYDAYLSFILPDGSDLYKTPIIIDTSMKNQTIEELRGYSELFFEKDNLIIEDYKFMKSKGKLSSKFEFLKSRGLKNDTLGFGLDGIGEGWYPILSTVFKEINTILKENSNINFRFTQIKEKFGGLRLYYEMYIKEGVKYNIQNTIDMGKISTIINWGENTSFKTCEVCGKDGDTLDINNWIYTVCNEHKESLINGKMIYQLFEEETKLRNIQNITDLNN